VTCVDILCSFTIFQIMLIPIIASRVQCIPGIEIIYSSCFVIGIKQMFLFWSNLENIKKLPHFSIFYRSKCILLFN